MSDNLSHNPGERMMQLLRLLYGDVVAMQVWPQLAGLLDAFRAGQASRNRGDGRQTAGELTERDAILITYGDQIGEASGEGGVEGKTAPPLRTLADFLGAELADCISGVHILPCFPYSSDDGFSVIDYTRIDPALGDWADVARLGRRYRLMFDFVANHISQESTWFQAYRRCCAASTFRIVPWGCVWTPPACRAPLGAICSAVRSTP